MFKIFFQNCFVQILTNFFKSCIMQIIVKGGYAVMKTNGMRILYLSVISYFQYFFFGEVNHFYINVTKCN